MDLGVNLIPDSALPLAQEAERLGYTTALAPEGLRDAISLLGWIAGQTTDIGLLSGVCQIPARTPVLAAMSAGSLNMLSGGRFRLGLGISNAYATTNWYGQAFEQPLGRTREYVDIVRMALRGEEVRYHGRHHTLPRSPETGTGFRIADRGEVPIQLAAVGPKNLELAGEIADGWVGVFYSVEQVARALPRLAAGRALAGRTLEGFELTLTVPLAIGPDPRELAVPITRYVAHFLSLGHREENFYYRIAAEMGLGAQAALVQDRYADGDAAGAAAAVPFEFVDEIALLGPADRIAARMKAYADAGVTTLCVGPYASSVEGRLEALRVARAAIDSFAG